MTRQRLLPFLCIAAAALAATSVWLSFQLQEERRLNAELAERLARPPVVAVEPPPPPPAATPAPAPPSPVTTPAPAALAQDTTRQQHRERTQESDWQERQRRLLQDPRYAEEVKRQQRTMQASHRPHATQVVGLTDAQFDAAVDLWAEREIAMQVARMSGSDRSAAQEEADRNYENSLKALLNEPLASRWKHYRDSLPTRMRVTNLRAQLTGADSLRDDQFEPLIEAMEVEQSQLRQELRQRRNELESGAITTKQSWTDYQEREIKLFMETKKRVLAAASPILSSSQLKQLETMYEQEVESRRASLRMNQLQQKIQAQEQPSDVN